MLEWSVDQKEHSCCDSCAVGEVISSGIEDKTDYSVLNKFKVEEQGSDVAIIGLGNFFHLGARVKNLLAEKLGISSTLINPKFITGIVKSC